MKVLVLGGAGFLGKNITEAFICSGYDVFVLDKECTHLKLSPEFKDVKEFYNGDVTDIEFLIKLVDEHGITCVVNLVSTLIPSSSFDAFSQELAVIICPAMHLVRKLAERKVGYVFFSSGGTVYGQQQHDMIPENSICKPINYYGYSKLLFEEYIALTGRISDLNYLIIRPSNPYGPFQNTLKKQGVVPIFLDHILQGHEIEIWGDGSTVRDYVWVKDVASALVKLLNKGVWNKTFNIGQGVGHSLIEVISLIEGITGKEADIRYKSVRAVDVPKVVLDVTELKDQIDYNPMPLKEGIYSYYGSLNK